MTTNLPNGCYYTKIFVSPSNWKTLTTQKSLKLNWFVECKYFDPLFKEKYPYGFPFRKKINKIRTLEERKAVIELLFKEIPVLFEKKGYNPITKKYIIQPEKPKHGKPHPELPVIDALRLVKDKLKVSKKHKNEVRIALNRIEKAINKLDMNEILIKDFKRSELKSILDYLELTDSYYNKFRSYLSSLFNVLIEYECCEVNIARDIRKLKETKKIRETLEFDDLKKITEYLQENQPAFYRYLMIFFYSGARSSELMRVQKKDVNINKQEYRVVIQKGRSYTETIKVILPAAIPFWSEVLNEAKMDDYLFAKHLKPDSIAINPNRITRRWLVIKKKFNITADFYSLKHLFLDELDKVTQNSDLNLSSKMASHTTSAITNSVYLVGKKKRENEILKTINITM